MTIRKSRRRNPRHPGPIARLAWALLAAGGALGMGTLPVWQANASGPGQGGTRWGESTDGKGAVEVVPPPSAAKQAPRPPGWKVLKADEKVPANTCDANPVACICPDNTTKVEFWEGNRGREQTRRKVMCSSLVCRSGTVLRKKANLGTGQVSFACEAPAETPTVAGKSVAH